MPYAVFLFFGSVIGFTWPLWAGTFILCGVVASVVVAVWADYSKNPSSRFFRDYARALVYRGYLPGTFGLLVGALFAVL